jgi:hypothetical protein
MDFKLKTMNKELNTMKSDLIFSKEDEGNVALNTRMTDECIVLIEKFGEKFFTRTNFYNDISKGFIIIPYHNMSKLSFDQFIKLIEMCTIDDMSELNLILEVISLWTLPKTSTLFEAVFNMSHDKKNEFILHAKKCKKLITDHYRL